MACGDQSGNKMKIAAACLLMLWVMSVNAADLDVYDDALQNTFQDFSYGGGSNFNNATPVHAGAKSISFVGNNFNALSFARATTLSTTNYNRLQFWVHGGTVGGQQLRVYLQNNNTIVMNAEIDTAITSGAIAANTWRSVTVDFDAATFAYSGSFDRIDLQSDVNGTQSVLYVDDMVLLARPVVAVDPIFANNFEGNAAPGIANLLIEQNVVSGGMTSDRFTWTDRGGLPRVLGLAQSSGVSGPGGSKGGEMREFRYQVGGVTRTVLAPANGAGGFGYVVSHRSEGGSGLGGQDDSPLGHQFAGTFTRLFAGRHHAIFRFNLTYPRWATTTAATPNQRYDVPVTIDWMVSNGRDFPLWAISYDLTGIPANAVEGDTRSPYGELLFDGSTNEATQDLIGGVAWGDRYKFRSTTAPLSYQSAWTWNVANRIPYVMLWTQNVDAQMGSVQTQTIQQQDAGGYFGSNRWNSTSAAGNGCTSAGSVSPMPCDFNWPYQSVNYSFASLTANTSNSRLAWGANFGFLGQTAYPIHGSDFYGGPLAGDPRASGWPRKSYSIFVVLDKHSIDAVGATVGEMETVQDSTLTASVGSVETTGPAGVNRPDTVTYAPAGWNHVYAAWALRATANQVNATLTVAAGRTLKRPLLQINNYTGALPTQLRLDGGLLLADTDYLLSTDASNSRLWITLIRDLAAGAHTITLAP
jgi:hypothetical protein